MRASLLSHSTLVWAGATASAAVVAWASALYWSHPGFLWRNPATPPFAASAPAEPKAPPALRTESAVRAAPPLASAPASGRKAPDQVEASPVKPAPDAANVDRSGEAVIAGRSAPNAKVGLRGAGQTVAGAAADAGDRETSKAVAVPVFQPEEKAAVSALRPEPQAAPPTSATALAPPAQAMRILATAPPARGAPVAIQSVEAGASGGLVAKGWAGPNATVRLYLNEANIADARTQSDGRWSLTIRHGMIPGAYVIRADEITPRAVSALASADTPFEYPAQPASAPSGLSPADPVIESVQTALVVPGHTLWALSRNYYGDPTRYPLIYEANKWEIRNPDLIYPGQVFVVPKFEPKP